MTFPLGVTTELLIDGSWVDITASTYQRDPIQIVRGRADESAKADPSRCSLTIDNRSGNYSPRNPAGAYHRLIGRNTALRVLAPTGLDNYMALAGGPELAGPLVSHAFSFDGAALDVTGDIDIRMDLEPDSWRPPDTVLTFDDVGLVRKYQTDSDQRSWALLLKTDGTLEFTWSDDGTDAGDTTVVSTVAVPEASTRLAVRVTLDVDNGAAGNDVAFYTAPTIDGSWTQLGATVTTAGVTSIFSSAADVEIGRTDADDVEGVPGSPLQGKVYAFELRDGIGGSLRAKPDFRTLDVGASEFQDAQGIPWELRGHATIANPNARFHGEVASWPQTWDRSGKDVSAPVEAYGLMRRLGQGATPLRSALFRDLSTRTGVVAYWPLEEPAGATRFGSGLTGITSLLASSSPVQIKAADDGDTFLASEPLPTIKDGSIAGPVPSYSGASEQVIAFLMAIPPDVTWGSDKLVTRFLLTGGTLSRVDISVTSSGTSRVQVYDADGAEVDNEVDALNLIGGPSALSLGLQQIGADTWWSIQQYSLQGGELLQGSGVVAGATYGRFSSVQLGSIDNMEGATFGHLFIVNDSLTAVVDVAATSMIGWSGESAPDRIVRLCHQEGIPVTVVGNISGSTLLGVQRPETLLDLLREAADSDLGILYEPREFLGLAYRTRASLYSQDPALTLNYAAGDLSSIDPVEDDQGTRNDVTVKREGGSSARAELTSGALSTAAPPAGVGRYDTAVTISASTDDVLADQAGWRLRLGTVDEARYPQLGVDLATDSFTGDADLTTAAQGLDVGDKLSVADLPAWMPPEDVTQIVQGFTETLTRYQWIIAVNCSPGSPWDVGIYDESDGVGEARYSSDGSTLLSGAALLLDGVSPGRASTPDTASLDVVGDLDVRAFAALDDWTPAAASTLLSKWNTTGNQRSWMLSVLATGALRLSWSEDGTAVLTADSTANPVVAPGEALWVRATIDVDNGAAGRSVRFYTAPVPTGEPLFSQLGATVTTAGVTSIFSSTAEVAVGAIDSGTAERLAGRVFAAEVRNGIAGTRVADVDFGAQEPGATSFVDDVGVTWTVTDPAVIDGSVIHVSTPSGPLWDDADAPYDLDIGGEQVTLLTANAILSPQVFTVTRSVNQISKAHAAGTEVRLYSPTIYGL